MAQVLNSIHIRAAAFVDLRLQTARAYLQTAARVRAVARRPSMAVRRSAASGYTIGLAHDEAELVACLPTAIASHCEQTVE